MIYTYSIERCYQPGDGLPAAVDDALNALRYAAEAASGGFEVLEPQITPLPDGQLYYLRTLRVNAEDMDVVYDLIARYFPKTQPAAVPV